ncbi:Insulinase (Peptidase M16) [Serendipita sp. 399]|nr:Insulinase (Peptidase M16) [Serendipita sp. 399]
MDIDVVLTKLGLAQYETVLSAIFHYITLLPSAPEEPYHFDETRKMAQIYFANADKYAPDAYAKTISQSMNGEYKPEHIISRGILAWTFNRSYIEDILQCMTFEKARILVAANSFDSLDVRTVWEKEIWYGTEFAKHSITSDIHAILTPEDRAKLYLPKRNPLLPESLDVERRSGVEPLKRPVIVHQGPLSTLWYKKDDQFWVPKGSITLQIRSPLTSGTHQQWIQTKVYTRLVMDALIAIGYNANLAGLGYDVSSSLDGVFITVSGYNDKLLVALDMVLQQVQDLQIRDDRFDIEMEKVDSRSLLGGLSLSLYCLDEKGV